MVGLVDGIMSRDGNLSIYFFTFLTAKSDPGKKINIGCNMIISRMERLELLEFP